MSRYSEVDSIHKTNRCGNIRIANVQDTTHRTIQFINSNHIKKNVLVCNIYNGGVFDVMQHMFAVGRVWETKRMGLVIIRDKPTKGFIRISKLNESEVVKINLQEFISLELDDFSKKIIKADSEGKCTTRSFSINGLKYSKLKARKFRVNTRYYPGSMWLSNDKKVIKILERLAGGMCEFDVDGERFTKSIGCIRRGIVIKPSEDKNFHVKLGYEGTSKFGRVFKVTKLIGHREVEITFLGTNNKKIVQRHLVRDGLFKDTIDCKFGVGTDHETEDGVKFKITGNIDVTTREITFEDGYSIIVNTNSIREKSKSISRKWKYRVGSINKNIAGKLFVIKEHISHKSCLIKYLEKDHCEIMDFSTLEDMSFLKSIL